MNSKAFLRILNAFSSNPCAFTVKELLNAMDPALLEIVRTLRSNRNCLLKIRAVPGDDIRFIMDSTLFRWLADLNIRLAQAERFKLNERQVALLMSNLRIEGLWQSPPDEIVQWGEAFGLLSHCQTSRDYVFPLARVLAILPGYASAYAIRALRNLAENEAWRKALKEKRNQYIANGFSQFSDRTVHIVKARQEFFDNRIIPVEQLASEFGITRTRIGQIEKRFYQRLGMQNHKMREPFLCAMLYHYLHESGRMVVNQDATDASLWSFLYRVCKMRYAGLRDIRVTIPGISPIDIPLVTQSKFSEECTEHCVAVQLESIDKLCVMKDDMQLLIKRIAQFRQQKMNLEQRVHMTLLTIGRPAHFVRIMEKHNELFPACPATESTILGELIKKRGGIVWIGIHGTYALREWGYETPSKSLMDTVADIVEEVHGRSGQPVPLAVIQAELGKFRKVVKPTSLIMATQCNPKVRCVAKNAFLPRDPAEVDDGDELTVDRLDEILRGSQEKNPD